MLRLIIQNRFHLHLKYFSIRNSLRDVPSAPLFVDVVSIFVACAVEFQVGVLAPEDFSVSNLPVRRLTIRRSCACWEWEMAWDSPIVNIVLQTIKRQLFMNTLVIDGNSKSLLVKCCLETKMRRDVKLHCGHHRIQVKMRAASLQLAGTHTQFPHCAKHVHNKIINSLHLACVQTSPLPQDKSGEETSVNHRR